MKKNAGRIYPTRWFWIALLVPVGILLSMTVQPLLALYAGERITLQTVPVDPRDPFYGDYVQLRFAIEEVDGSVVDKTLVQKMEKNPGGDRYPVYVSLRKNGRTAVVAHVSEKPPRTSLYLKGELMPIWQWENGQRRAKYAIDYQLDRYYVEEDSGLEWEKLARQGKVWADVKVKGGYGVMLELKPAQ
ncbi:GDYXXLXY domain-containing protein [Laceyella tengchongensis]|uniref:GDYXXLXY domain-containing protein n=1 Tax=Laceyella tengchongensis TaxID=574699 RepID=UPI0012B8143B|nr:hypothetical protein [Laceyella tengchongensis]